MRTRARHPFTMIEILLALGVTAIGICSIMVLFPIGANANRDAAMETYTANAADELLHYYQYELQKNNQWANYITTHGSSLLIPDSDTSDVDLSAIADWESTSTLEFPNITRHKTNKHVYLLTNIGNGTQWSSSVTLQDINWAAIIVITKKTIHVNNQELNKEYGITLQAEVSWPAQVQKSSRKKAVYLLDVCNTK